MGRVLSLVVRASPNTMSNKSKTSERNANKCTENSSNKSAKNEKKFGLYDTLRYFWTGLMRAGVARLQYALIKLGYMKPSDIRFRSGFYGPRTTEAITRIGHALTKGSKVLGIFTDEIRTKILKELEDLENGTLVLHHTVRCDGSNEYPLRGVRFHKIGKDYHLNKSEFDKLSMEEKQAFEVITRPGARPIPVNVYFHQSAKKTDKPVPRSYPNHPKKALIHPFAQAILSMASNVATSYGATIPKFTLELLVMFPVSIQFLETGIIKLAMTMILPKLNSRN